ncbi:sarcosine oxidase subunit gamma family protein [Lentzea sp. NPDC051838]|uniref:sarcosine oxidase subunit gamma n=1 Tax=Lentzea sp. NPDC051838 TaxID=3154849 RepID=UPI003442B289
MADLRRSPLAHVQFPAGLAELPFRTMVNLRVDPSSERVEKALGVALPQQCGQTSVSGARTVFWLGPDEWLVLDDEPGIHAELVEALAGESGSAVDVSANRTIVELSGPFARDVLEKGCPVDLHPRAFGPGQAVQTTVGPVPVLLWQVGDETYRLFPRSSFADYLARWLIDAMSEY